MTKKIKIISAIILIAVALITVSLVALTFNTTSHSMQINAPERIIVYYNSASNNKVFEKNTDEYNQIYSLIIESYKQPILKAFTTNKLFKDVKIVKTENSLVNFSGIKINFVYDTPQAVKYKSKLYIENDKTAWYQSLIFDIVGDNKYQYNSVAIIPPETSTNYVSPYEYSLKYNAYSNFNKLYNVVLKLFK